MPPAPSPFRSLFEEHAAFVWRVLRRHGVAEADLEDGCQEVFLVVHRRLSEFEGRSSLRTWIYGVAARVALGMRRRVHHVRERLDADAPEQDVPAPQLEQMERRERMAMVEAALRSLSDDKREVFALYELEGMTMAEVATALGVPENTALYRLYAARDEIKSFVKRQALPQARSRGESTTEVDHADA